MQIEFNNIQIVQYSAETFLINQPHDHYHLSRNLAIKVGKFQSGSQFLKQLTMINGHQMLLKHL